MEISIKWNLCRTCLSEECPKNIGDKTNPNMNAGSTNNNTHKAKHLHIDTKIAQQIFECSGVKVEQNDSLPDKICRKCSMLLRNAMQFKNTCHNSNEYLQSVLRRTKSANSMLKLDKRRERALELLDEMLNEENEMNSATLDIEVQHNSSEEADSVLEMLADSVGERRRTMTPLRKLLNSSPKTLNVCSTINEVNAIKENRIVAANFVAKENTVEDIAIAADEDFVEEKRLVDELVEHLPEDQEDYADNEFEHLELECKKDKCSKQTSESDDGSYTEDNDQIDVLDATNDHDAYNISERKNEIEAEAEGLVNMNSEMESDGNIVKIEDTAMQEIETYYYIMDSPNIKQENESSFNGGGHGDSDVSEHNELVEKTNSMVPLEEYLLEQSDTEDDKRGEYVLRDNDHTKGASIAGMKITSPRFATHSRKKVGDTLIFVCDVCGNQFTNRSLMNFHMRIHRKEKNYECELCFKRFTAACNLTAHMRIHTGEKPFECKFCQRRFTDRSTHIKHERVHTNEKPFQCNICGKAFALSTTLRTHEKVHTGEKPFKCIPCKKSFKLPHQLKSHLNTNQHKMNKPL